MASVRDEWLYVIDQTRSGVHRAHSLLPELTAIEQSEFELALAELDQSRRRAEASSRQVGGFRVDQAFETAQAALADLEYVVGSAQAVAMQIQAVRSAAAAIRNLVSEIGGDDGFGGTRIE